MEEEKLHRYKRDNNTQGWRWRKRSCTGIRGTTTPGGGGGGREAAQV